MTRSRANDSIALPSPRLGAGAGSFSAMRPTAWMGALAMSEEPRPAGRSV
ncbi:hypothetical protein ACFPRL_08280 [Pseudoclavibacter helvolus]